MLKRLIFAFSSAFAALLSAHAADACPAARFGGAYAGGSVGAIHHSATRTDMDGAVSPLQNVFTDITGSDTSVTLGGVAGYDWQVCNTLVGVVTDFNWAGVSTSAFQNPNNPLVVEESLRTQMNWFGTVRGRAGLAVDNTLLYLTGGVAVARTKTTLTKDLIFGNGVLNDQLAFSKTRLGVAGGVGAEFLIGGNWSVSTELLYLQLAKQRQTQFSQALATGNFDIESNDRAVIARLGLNYRFDTSIRSTGSTSVTPVWPSSSAPRFAGFYIGGSVGAISGTHLRQDQDGYVSDTVEYTATGNNVIGGLQVGRDWQAGSAVAGVVADVSGSALRAQTRINPNNFGIPGLSFDQTFTTRMPWLATARGRAGLALDSALLYVTAGAAVAQIETTVNNTVLPIFSEQNTLRDIRYGIVGGIGAEFQPPGALGEWLGPNWTTTTELLHVAFAKKKDSLSSRFIPVPLRVDAHDSAWISRVGLNYRFNAPGRDGRASCAASKFTGLHAGAHLGGISTNSLRQDQDTYFQSNADYTLSAQGVTGGGYVGYDWQGCRALFGVVADLSAANNRGVTQIGPNIAPLNGVTLLFDSRVGPYGTLRTRSGLVAGDSLFYLTGGLAAAQIRTVVSGIAPGVTEINSSNVIRLGWTGGVGAETTIAGGWRATAELLHMQFARQNFSFFSPSQARTVSFEENDSAIVGRIGLGYRFAAGQ